MNTQQAQFFTGQKCLLTLVDVKPKLNQQNDKRLRFDFAMPLTAEILKSAPRDVKDAFYAVSKDESHLNPIGIGTEFDGVVVNIFDTPLTKHARLELANCTLKQLEVARPDNKAMLNDGDVRLSFHMNVPASRDAWNWGYGCYGSDLCAVFEEMQPIFPQIKEANPNGDGQVILEMDKSEAHSTVAKPDELPRQSKEQKASVSKIKVGKKSKK